MRDNEVLKVNLKISHIASTGLEGGARIPRQPHVLARGIRFLIWKPYCRSKRSIIPLIRLIKEFGCSCNKTLVKIYTTVKARFTTLASKLDLMPRGKVEDTEAATVVPPPIPLDVDDAFKEFMQIAKEAFPEGSEAPNYIECFIRTRIGYWKAGSYVFSSRSAFGAC